MFSEEYLRKEKEFMDRHDSLCEDVAPDLCDCSVCPTRDLCKSPARNGEAQRCTQQVWS